MKGLCVPVALWLAVMTGSSGRTPAGLEFRESEDAPIRQGPNRGDAANRAGRGLDGSGSSDNGGFGSVPANELRRREDILGVTHVAGKYYFGTDDFLNEGADRLLNSLGTKVIKVWFHRVAEKYPWNSAWPTMNNLLDQAKAPYFIELFAKPFSAFILLAQTEVSEFRDGMTAGEIAAERKQFYDLTTHLLNTYQGTGKTFVLQHWEGDWLIRGHYDPGVDPTATAIAGMIAWLNARQAGVNQARSEFSGSGVKVYHAAEVNIVVKSMNEGRTNVINAVVPYTNVDMVSYSSYDALGGGPVVLKNALDFIALNTPDHPDLGDKNVYLGEYGFPENELSASAYRTGIESATRTALDWGCRYLVFWELYCNENYGGTTPPITNNGDCRGFWLVRPDGSHSWGWDYFSDLLKPVQKNLLGTWDGQGVYFRDSTAGTWTILASPADMIAGGDLYGDGTDDLIGIWSGQAGVWIRDSADGTWTYLSSPARHIAAGDVNGDGRADFLGTWDGQGVFAKDSVTGAWTLMATPATLIAAGDLDGDGKDDLIGIWPSQAGVWVKSSQAGNWSYLGSSLRDLSTGDMNGDGRTDLVGTWDGQGVFYRNSLSGSWVMMATPADQVAAGDLDGDGTDDLIGIWAGQAGVWVKSSATGTWAYIGSSARDITTGKMGGGDWGSASNAASVRGYPSGGYSEGPPRFEKSRDASSESPGGNRFLFEVGVNLSPRRPRLGESLIPGPGDPGFQCERQQNLIPMPAGAIKNNKGNR